MKNVIPFALPVCVRPARPMARVSSALLLLAVLSLCAASRAVTIYVSAYGAVPDDGVDDTAGINAAIAAAASGDVVALAAGTYDLSTPVDSAKFLYINGKASITLQGAVSNGVPTTTLLRHVSNPANPSGLQRLLYVVGGSSITIENLNFDNTPELCSGGTVTEINKSLSYIKVQLFPGVPTTQGGCYSSNAWDPTANTLKQVPDLASNTSAGNWSLIDSVNRIMQLNGASTTLLNNVAVNDRISWHNGISATPQVDIEKTNGVTLQNLTVWNAYDMAFLFGGVKDITLTNISITPGGNQLTVGPRDGIHLSRCQGVVTCSGLYVSGVHEDGFVVRSPYGAISSVSSGSFTLTPEINTFGETIPAGSSMTAYDATTGARTTFPVSSAVWNGSQANYAVTTTAPTSTNWNVAKTSGLMPSSVSITDSIFTNIAGSALILFADNTSIGNSQFSYVMYPAIDMGSNPTSGICGDSISVNGSTFDHCSWVAKPETKIPGIITLVNAHNTYTKPVVTNISIQSNTFKNQLTGASGSAVINARNTAGLTVSGNLFSNVYKPIYVDSTVSGASTSTCTEIVDNDNNAVTYSESGTFANSSLTGYNGGLTRYSATAGARATWTFVAPNTATYAVYVYKIQSSTSDTAAQIAVTNDGTTGTASIDYTAGTSGWVLIGTYSYTSGRTYTVTNTRTNGYLRADAVKFVQQ